jgi:hypothetical protein
MAIFACQIISFMAATSVISNQLVTLNVGNKVNYTTQKSILIKCSFFKSMFNFQVDLSKPIFIDCEPHAFEHILEYLRYANYQIPSRYKYLATFFGIDDAAFEDVNTKPMIIMWEGEIIRVNKQEDIYLTIEDALKLLVSVYNQKAPDTHQVKSLHVFKLMSRLMSHPTIISICLDDRIMFIQQTFRLIEEVYDSIFDENNNLRFKICVTAKDKVDNKSYYDEEFKLYIQTNRGIYNKNIVKLFNDLSSKHVTRTQMNYVNNFIKRIQANPLYENIKHEIVYYKALK